MVNRSLDAGCHKIRSFSVTGVKYDNNRNHAKGETIMLKRRIALALPILALSLSVLACNFPGLDALDAQASELAEEEIAALVDAALVEMQAEVEEALPEPVVDDQGQAENQADSQEETEPEAEPVVTEEPEPVVTEEPEPAPPEIEACTDRAQFVADLTVEDGADFAPGQAFTKTWRLRNNGSCTWTSSYDLVFDHGDHMGGPATKALPGIVEPGGTVDISVDLVAPSAEGGYIGYWLLRNAEGMLFGIGADANVAFWVEIEVLEEEEDSDFPVFEIVPIPVFPLFVSSGSGQSLVSGACFDLDAGAVVGCASGDADLRYFAQFETVGFPPMPKLTLEIQPRNGARFALFGNDLPTGSECQASALSGSAFNIQAKTYCYQTDAGKYGRITIVNGDLGGVTFDWATYTSP
jgi:hypothetical protein